MIKLPITHQSGLTSVVNIVLPENVELDSYLQTARFLRVREDYKGTDVTYKEKEYFINLDTVIFVGEPFYENPKGAAE